MRSPDENRVWVCFTLWERFYTIKVSRASCPSELLQTHRLQPGIGDAGEDGTFDAQVLAEEETYAQTHPLPAHLAKHERRRYENDLDVSYSHGVCQMMQRR